VTAMDTHQLDGPATADTPDATPSDERLDRIEERLDALLAHAERRDAELEPLRDLAAEVGVLSGPVMTSITAQVAGWDERGYLGFARSSARVVDQIVTSFDEQDVEALGDNVVLMLETLRDLTQPEILRLLRQTAGSVSHLDGHAEGAPPSTFALLRELRDPEVRRGLGRMLDLLRSVGAEGSAIAGSPATHGR
jgi:uncharacterized protein YjgD (DUF1641 family)